MNKYYALARNVIGSRSVLQVDESEYGGLLAARDALLDALFLEEKFDLIVQNYLELETELLDATAQDVVTNAADWSWFQSKRSVLNRRLMNLLSSARGYREYVEHLAPKLLPNEAAERCVIRFSTHYDSCVGYRVMEALRNYTQHRGFPIHALQLEGTKNESETRNRIAFGIGIYTKTSYLRQGKKFNSKVLAELDALGGRVDVKPMVRDYIAALADIHDHFRQELAPLVSAWESLMQRAIQRFRESFPAEESLVGLAALVIDGNERKGEVPLFADFIEYRRQLAKKNSGMARLGVLYVTGATIGAPNGPPAPSSP